MSKLLRIQNWEQIAVVAGYSAANLALRCQVSPRQLERFFIKSENTSPGQWLKDLRVQHGKELLAAGKSVKEISHSVGFKKANSFSRAFKANVGMAPTIFLSAGPPD